MIKIIKAATAVFSALPGVAALLTGLGAPPNMKVVFGSMSTIAGVIIVLVLHVWRHRIKHLAQAKLRNWVLVTFGILFFMVVGYIAFFDHCCVMGTTEACKLNGRVSFPIWTTGKLNQRISSVKGRKAFVDHYGPKTADQELDKMSGITLARVTTIIILLVLFCLIPMLATCSLGVLALYLQGKKSPLGVGQAARSG